MSRPAAPTTLSRCAARYAWLFRCSLGEAALAFEITPQAVRHAWLRLYPDVPVTPAIRGLAERAMEASS